MVGQNNTSSLDEGGVIFYPSIYVLVDKAYITFPQHLPLLSYLIYALVKIHNVPKP